MAFMELSLLTSLSKMTVYPSQLLSCRKTEPCCCKLQYQHVCKFYIMSHIFVIEDTFIFWKFKFLCHEKKDLYGTHTHTHTLVQIHTTSKSMNWVVYQWSHWEPARWVVWSVMHWNNCLRIVWSVYRQLCWILGQYSLAPDPQNPRFQPPPIYDWPAQESSQQWSALLQL